MINNDTVIKDKDFLKGIIEEYYNSRYDILGPRIISLVDNQNQNPAEVIFENSKHVKNSIYKIKLLLFLEYIYLYEPIKRLFKIFKRTKNINDKNISTTHTMLHGSCLIFSKDYIKRYNGRYDKTFMFGEENILYFIARRDNLTMRYTDKITIYHKEDSATASIMKKEREKRIFHYKNVVNSLKLERKLCQKIIS